MGLVLVREPYYNEAGFGVFEGADEVSLASALYSEKAYILSRGFVKHVLETPMSGFEDEIKWLYLPHQRGGLNLLEAVIGSTREVVKRSECEGTMTGE
jgi:ubiquitin-conjugating enzyme E2 O